MNIVEKMSRTNYKAFISLIADSNKVDSNWSIKVDDSENNYPRNNKTIHDILLTTDEVIITHGFQNNDIIVVCKSFDKYTLSYQGSGKYIKEYEELIDKIVEGSTPVSSSIPSASSTYRYTNRSE